MTAAFVPAHFAGSMICAHTHALQLLRPVLWINCRPAAQVLRQAQAVQVLRDFPHALHTMRQEVQHLLVDE